jgi:preprotein translocase subunit SecG
MTVLIMSLHVLCALLLITVILMQSGRGGGLTEAFASAESVFGTKTNIFMVRATMTLACVFLVTSLVLAHLSARKKSSLIPETMTTQPLTLPESAAVVPTAAEPKAEAAPSEAVQKAVAEVLPVVVPAAAPAAETAAQPAGVQTP